MNCLVCDVEMVIWRRGPGDDAFRPDCPLCKGGDDEG